MEPITIVLCVVVYLFCSLCAGLLASLEERPRDIVLIHILLGPIVCVLTLIHELFWFAGQGLKFLAGAWSDFRGRF